MTEQPNTPAEGAAAPKTGKPGKPAKQRPALDLTSLEVTQITERRTMAEFRRTRGEREPEQIAVDQIVSKAYDAWLEAGKPENWVNRPGMLLRVPFGQLETLQYRIRKAGIFYDLKIRFGDVKINGAGKSKVAEVVFTAMERPADEQADEVEEEDGDDSGNGSDE